MELGRTAWVVGEMGMISMPGLLSRHMLERTEEKEGEEVVGGVVETGVMLTEPASPTPSANSMRMEEALNLLLLLRCSRFFCLCFFDSLFDGVLADLQKRTQHTTTF